MATIEPSYTKMDYEAIRKWLIEQVPKFTDRWTDFSDTDPGAILIALMAAIKDMQNYMMDKKSLELFLPTVKERKNAQSILKIIGYKMHTYISSVCTMRVSIKDGGTHPHDILIPAYTQFSIEENEDKVLFFAPLSDERIFAGQNYVEFVATEGLVRKYKFKKTDIDAQGRILLPDKRVAQGSISISDEDTPWVEVEDVAIHTEQGRFFSMHIGRDDEVYIHLSPAWVDILIDDVSVLDVKYLISSGKEGTVGSNKVVELIGDIYDVMGNNVTSMLEFSNITEASGGDDPETVEHARIQAPKIVKTMWTAVTLNDYKVLAESYPGIAKAMALDWNYPESGITVPYEVNVYIVPADGTVASPALKDQLKEYLSERRLASIKLNIMDPDYVLVDLDVNVYVPRGYRNKALVQETVVQAIDEYFALDNWEFGQDLRYSRLVSVLQNCHPDIKYVHITSFNSDIGVGPTQVIKLNSRTVNVLEEVDL